MAKFLSLAKKQNQIKHVHYLDDLNKDALSRKMFKMYYACIYPTSEKQVKEVEKNIDFEGSSRSVYWIINILNSCPTQGRVDG